MSECSVCVEKYNKSTRKCITCLKCNYEACASCCSNYILNSINEARCMNCNNFWNRAFLTQNFTKKFVHTDYKKHKQNLLWDREKAKLEEAYICLENFNLADKEEEELNIINKEIQKLYELKVTKVSKIGKLRDIHNKNKTNEEKIKFFGHCPNNGCKGLINSNWRCLICDQRVCRSCKEKVGNGEDDLKLHSCDPNTLENLKLIKNDSKQCPQCKTFIYKIDGCNQMWCTNCNIAFCWRTGEIYKGRHIHNPHYFAWREQNRTNDNLRGGICDAMNIVRNIRYKVEDLYPKLINRNYYYRNDTVYSISDKKKIPIYKLYNICSFMYSINRHMLEARERITHKNPIEWKISYVKGDLQENEIKQKIQQDNKKVERNIEKANIFEMHINSFISIVQEYVLDDTNKITQLDLINYDEVYKIYDELVEYTNEVFKTFKDEFNNISYNILYNETICEYTIATY